MYEELVKDLRDWPRVCVQYDGSADQLHDEAADAIETMCEMVATAHGELSNVIQSYEESKPRWIPVTERLPEHGWYLVYGPTIKMEVLHYHSAEEVWSSKRYYNIEVTHWMPLPEPPKEET